MTLRVSSLGVRSTSRSAGDNFCMGFFFAFMMFGRDAYRGSFNLQPRITHVSSCAPPPHWDRRQNIL